MGRDVFCAAGEDGREGAGGWRMVVGMVCARDE